MLRVLVVETAGDQRLADAVSAAPATELAAVAATGRQAIELTQRIAPDAILMSSSVAGINAFEATRAIMTVAPTPIIVVVDETGAAIDKARSRAEEAGALAALPFPARAGDLIDTVHTLASVGLVRHRPRSNGSPARAAKRAAPPSRPASAANVIAIAASTGGPGALRRIFAELPPAFGAPILVTQHISAGFSDGMVCWWNAFSPLRAKIAEDGEPLSNGTIYVAPDNRHLTVSGEVRVALSDAPHSGGHRPSANVMFRSVAERFGTGALAVILTGMGRDGVEGLADVRRLGGTVCAQDETSSAVFGMPKAAIEADVVDIILPLHAISRRIADAVATP